MTAAVVAAELPIANSMTGTFRTTPDHLTSRPLSFVVGGDLGGQSYCRRTGEVGYPIFSIMQALSPDFFLFNGDQIYGDDTCKVTGPSNVTGWYNIPGNFPSITDNRINWTNETQLQDVYNEHWEYNRGDLHFKLFYAILLCIHKLMIMKWQMITAVTGHIGLVQLKIEKAFLM